MEKIIYQNFYSHEIDHLALREALDTHYQVNPQFTPRDQYHSKYAKNMLKAHDISHVISGCDTSYKGEVLVQVWTFLYTKLPMDEFWAYYKDKESQVLLNPTNKWRIFGEFLLRIPDIIGLWCRSLKMKKKWVYFDEEKYMDKTVGEIREEYNILLAR